MHKEFLIENIHDYFDKIIDGFNQPELQQIDDEQIFILPKTMGEGKIRRIKVRKGLEMIISDLELSEHLTFQVNEKCGIVELNYCLSGETLCEFNEQHLEIINPVGNVCYFHGTKVHLQRMANVRNHILEVRLSPESFLGYFENKVDRMAMEKRLEQQKGKIKSYQLSPMIKKCVYEILNCPYHGSMKKVFLEAKGMELITLYFGETEFNEAYSKSAFQEEDIEKLKQAKNIVLNHLEHPYSIKDLANQVGLNEFKLKNGFRELFGMPVFAFIRNKRIEKAVWLMETKGWNVSEVAMAIGYSNPSNFTVAFRKQYGCNPSVYLNRLKNK